MSDTIENFHAELHQLIEDRADLLATLRWTLTLLRENNRGVETDICAVIESAIAKAEGRQP